jgi:hypothetical protein
LNQLAAHEVVWLEQSEASVGRCRAEPAGADHGEHCVGGGECCIDLDSEVAAGADGAHVLEDVLMSKPGDEGVTEPAGIATDVAPAIAHKHAH